MIVKRVTALLTSAVMTCIMALNSMPTFAQEEDVIINEQPFITNYQGNVQILKDEETIERSFYLSAEKVVNVNEIAVCGWAEAGSDVDIYLNGKKVKTLTANDSTGIYSGVITLTNAKSGSEHQLYAVCNAEKSNIVKTVYDVNKPTVEKVEMDIDGSDRKDITNVFTQGALLDVEFILGCPINFHIKTTNSDSICRMFVTSGQGEDARMLEAFYRPEDDIWETDGLFAPDDAYYTPEELNICIIENGAGVVIESDIDTEKIGLNNIPEKVIENSSSEVLYHDDDTQLTRINISDGIDSDYYEILNSSVDTITVDGVEYPKEEIAKAPEKYGFSKSVSIVNNDGSITRTYIKTEGIYPDCDSKIKELQDVCFDIVKKGTKILTTGSVSAQLEIAVKDTITDNVPMTTTVEATITAVEGIADVVKILADDKAPSVTPASMIKSILSAGSTWAGRMKDAQSNYNDKDMMIAASITLACKVGIIVFGGLLTAATGGVTGAVIATAGSTIFNIIEKMSWHDVKTFNEETVYETTEKPKYSVKTSDFEINYEGTITAYNGNSSYVAVPPVINGIVVSSISSLARVSHGRHSSNTFSNESIEYVVLPDTVTKIERGALSFATCPSLKSVTIPDSVTSIGQQAFEGSLLENVTIPDSVTSIGDQAFAYCSLLKNVTISDSVTSIGNYTFEDCPSLTSVTIPDSVTSIGDQAFARCTSLTSVTIPDSVTSIGDGAFANCTSLTSVIISDSLTSIGKEAFINCKSLTSVTIPDSVTSTGKESLKNVIPPDSVTSIGDRAFADCTSLKNVTIPDSITSIGNSSFAGCTLLTNVIISDSVTSIGEWAFYQCFALPSITIPDSVTSIDYSAFRECTSLTSVTIPDSLTSTGGNVFEDCKTLTSVIIPDSVTSIGNYTFKNCTSLKSITIPDSVKSIGNQAFWGCDSLKDIYYGGTEEQWMSVEKYRSYLRDDVTVHFNSPINTEPTKPVSATTRGDANLDGKVTVADAVAVLQYVANKLKYPIDEQGLVNADLDGSIGITGSDAIMIQKIDAGILK